METKQAVLPLSAPVSTSILLCFGNRHNHITVFDETIFVSSMTLYQQAGHSYIQMPFLRCKMLVGIVPDPLCTASAGCRLRICAKCFYNEKEHRGLPQKWEESSVFSAYRVCAFSLVAFSSVKKISTFFCAFISSCISSRALR